MIVECCFLFYALEKNRTSVVIVSFLVFGAAGGDEGSRAALLASVSLKTAPPAPATAPPAVAP